MPTCSVVTAGIGLPGVPTLVLSLPHVPYRGSSHRLGLGQGRQISQIHLPNPVSGVQQCPWDEPPAWSPLPWEWRETAAPAMLVSLSWQRKPKKCGLQKSFPQPRCLASYLQRPQVKEALSCHPVSLNLGVSVHLMKTSSKAWELSSKNCRVPDSQVCTLTSRKEYWYNSWKQKIQSLKSESCKHIGGYSGGSILHAYSLFVLFPSIYFQQIPERHGWEGYVDLWSSMIWPLICPQEGISAAGRCTRQPLMLLLPGFHSRSPCSSLCHLRTHVSF